MIIQFGEDVKTSTILKFVELLEKEKVDFKLIASPTLPHGLHVVKEDFHPDDLAPPREVEDIRIKQTPEQNDPLWRPGRIGSGHEHCGRDCKDIVHYGAEAL